MCEAKCCLSASMLSLPSSYSFALPSAGDETRLLNISNVLVDFKRGVFPELVVVVFEKRERKEVATVSSVGSLFFSQPSSGRAGLEMMELV
jgi:hypothetical protein